MLAITVLTYLSSERSVGDCDSAQLRCQCANSRTWCCGWPWDGAPVAVRARSKGSLHRCECAGWRGLNTESVARRGRRLARRMRSDEKQRRTPKRGEPHAERDTSPEVKRVGLLDVRRK